MENRKNILRINNLPSNTIEEAFIILKENKKVKKYEYTGNFNKNNNESDENNNYVIKEAEMIINDYLNSSESQIKKFEKKNKKLKYINAILGLLLIVSIIF